MEPRPITGGERINLIPLEGLEYGRASRGRPTSSRSLPSQRRNKVFKISREPIPVRFPLSRRPVQRR